MARAKTGEGKGRTVPRGTPGRRATLDNQAVRKQLHDGFSAMLELEGKRAEINDKINALRKGLFNLGLHKGAVRAGYTLYKLDAEQRSGYVATLSVLDKACQMGMFDEAGLVTAEAAHTSNPADGGGTPSAETGAEQPQASQDEERITTEHVDEAGRPYPEWNYPRHAFASRTSEPEPEHEDDFSEV